MAGFNNRNFPPVLMSNNQSSAYAGQASGLFGLAYGRGTNNTDVSVIGGVFGRKPTAPHVQYGLALLPPNAKNSANAGSLHWLGNDTNAYDGDITWKTTTITSNSAYTYFEIDGWQLKIGSTTVSNSNQDLASAVDLYHPNMFFPSSEAQLIRE